MYSFDSVALFYLFSNRFKKRTGEEHIPMREEIQQKEREWQDKWYNLNNNGVEVN